MQPAWMLSTNLKKNLITFFFIFFSIFIKKNNTSFFFFNMFFLFKLKFFFNLNNTFRSLIFNSFKINLKTNDFLQSVFEDYAIPVFEKFYLNKKSYLNKNVNSFFYFDNKFYYKLFNFFFLNAFLSYSSFFPRTGYFNLFFFKNSKGSSCLIDVYKVMNRWVDFFNLSINLYLMDLNPFIYSSPFFKNETLSLNWNLKKWDLLSWKLTYPYFIFKTNYFSQKTNFFYEKLREEDCSMILVSDCLYHYKNLYFFKKNNFYTIGLVTLNVNPWIVTYPVFASSNSYLNQIFFLQSLVYTQKKAFLLQFFFFKKLWSYSSFFLICR